MQSLLLSDWPILTAYTPDAGWPLANFNRSSEDDRFPNLEIEKFYQLRRI
jgi:hypothetical protein